MGKNINTEGLRCWAEIDVDALLGNFDAIRSFVPGDKKLMAVVKADGYGHGSRRIARLLEGKADFFGVAMLDEALELRREGITAPILVLGYTQPQLFSVAVRNDVRLSLFHTRDAYTLAEVAKEQGRDAIVHIAVDTGMGRIGYEASRESAEDIARIASLEGVIIEGLYSHLANADSSDKTYTIRQIRRFNSFKQMLLDLGVRIPLYHLYNSAATVDLCADFNMLREGIILYGLRPSEYVDAKGIGAASPVMSLRAVIGHVKILPEGSSVSYGCSYVTSRPTVIATVCAGYADGVPRLLSNKGSVMVNGIKVPIIGRVCMDQLMVDVTNVPGVKVGDVATIFGKDGETRISADDVADLADTIGYEIVCGVSKRVPRLYVKDSRLLYIDHCISHEE